MTARCQLCDAVVVSHFEPELILSVDQQMAQLQEYDQLSAHMWLHISDRHPQQTEEGILCQRRAAKMYAMNWATTDAELGPVKVQWRQALLLKLTVTTQFTGGNAQADAATDSPDSSSDGFGSNEKKSVRKVSN